MDNVAVYRLTLIILLSYRNRQKDGVGLETGQQPGKHPEKVIDEVDEEGVEVAVCRHGFLLRALNMFRGEIFAYPLFLQKDLSHLNIQFFCMDVVCKYWPYLRKVAEVCPEMKGLLNMHPFLSLMHAKAHSFQCEVGKFDIKRNDNNNDNNDNNDVSNDHNLHYIFSASVGRQKPEWSWGNYWRGGWASKQLFVPCCSLF